MLGGRPMPRKMEKFLQIAPHSLAIVLGPAEGPAGERSEAPPPAAPAQPRQLARHHIGYEIFADFKAENMQHFWNKKVTAAVAETFFLGWIDEQVLLIQGKEEHLEALREGWSRRALRPPSGFHIRYLGEAGRARPVPSRRVSPREPSPPRPSRRAGSAPPGARASLHPRAAPGEGPGSGRARDWGASWQLHLGLCLCEHAAPGRPATASLLHRRGGACGRPGGRRRGRLGGSAVARGLRVSSAARGSVRGRVCGRGRSGERALGRLQVAAGLAAGGGGGQSRCAFFSGRATQPLRASLGPRVPPPPKLVDF